MGYNTVVVVMNDSLDAIAKDPEFGKNLANAVSYVGCYHKPKDVGALGHINAATVIETQHADSIQIVAIGNNYGVLLGYGRTFPKENKDKVQLLREIAYGLGYRLCLKPTRR